jgi:hypothetical protein
MFQSIRNFFLKVSGLISRPFVAHAISPASVTVAADFTAIAPSVAKLAAENCGKAAVPPNATPSSHAAPVVTHDVVAAPVAMAPVVNAHKPRPAINLLAAQLNSVARRNTPAGRKARPIGPSLGLAQGLRSHRAIAPLKQRPKATRVVKKRSPRRRHVWLANTLPPAQQQTATILKFQLRPAGTRNAARLARLAA